MTILPRTNAPSYAMKNLGRSYVQLSKLHLDVNQKRYVCHDQRMKKANSAQATQFAQKNVNGTKFNALTESIHVDVRTKTYVFLERRTNTEISAKQCVHPNVPTTNSFALELFKVTDVVGNLFALRRN